MRFRPCIDIHNGKVKQIVGSTLADSGDQAEENYVSSRGGGYYAKMYKEHDLTGGHIIILNPVGSQYYEEDKVQAGSALAAFPGGLQIGGGINADNARDFLDAGASHVIVTSFVFKNGAVNEDNLRRLKDIVGKSRLVLDLSCRRREDRYYIVTDRWQKFTDVRLDGKSLDYFAKYCDQFLVHAADVEGKTAGIEKEVAALLGKECPIPCTYAGGISGYEDIELLDRLSDGKVDFTVGSALDIFGGKLSFEKLAAFGR